VKIGTNVIPLGLELDRKPIVVHVRQSAIDLASLRELLPPDRPSLSGRFHVEGLDVQIDPLRVETILPAARFGTIQVGQKATVIPEVPGDQLHVASVTLVERVIDPASGTFGVSLELPNPDLSIPSGLNCEVRFMEP